MSESVPRAPRVMVEELPSQRLDIGWDEELPPPAATAPPAAAAPRPWSSFGTAALGIAILVVGFAALDAANFVAAQFERSVGLGWLTLLIALGGGGLFVWGVSREVWALWALEAVDRARNAFAQGDVRGARAAAIRWAETVPAAAQTLPALRDAPDLATLRALLEAGPLPALDRAAEQAGRSAALQAFAATAITASPALDALVFGWRGVMLVRQVAALHGLRPGVVGTAALLRRTVFEAAAIGATDVAVEAAARALLTHPLLAHVAGGAATGAVAARRMILLSRAASRACRIIPAG